MAINFFFDLNAVLSDNRGIYSLFTAGTRSTMITKEPKKIILAEDTESFRNTVSGILTEAGHVVTHATDANAIMDEISKSVGVGALILDLDMPYLDGFSFLEKLREENLIGKFPVFCVTSAHAESDISAYVKGLGAEGVLTKDSSHAKILAAVNKSLFPEVTSTRKGTRVYRTIPAKFMLGAATHEGEILNISNVGVFIHTPLALRPCSMMRLSFSLGDNATISPSGVVRWVTGDENKDSRFVGAGIEFKNLLPPDKKAIKGYVELFLQDASSII